MRNRMNVIFLSCLLTGVLMLPLGGCAKKTAKVEQVEETAKVEDTVSAQPSEKQPGIGGGEIAKAEPPVVSEGAGPGESLETPAPSLEGTPGTPTTAGVVEGSRTSVGLLPVYFDFDKSIIRPDQVARLEANAQFLRENAAVKVRIEGNCDSRGTNEYNMALGERRAMGARKYLVNLGIDGSRLSTLSYGEERPVNPGNDETAWAENRRGDFVIVR